MITKPKIMAANSRRPWLTTASWTMGAILILVWGAVISGCASNYGRFARSPEVAAAIEGGQASPEYNYYFFGRERMPYALIGIDKTYQVASKLWIPFTPSNAKLQRMATFIYDYYDERAYGANILDPSGQPVGVWYSKISTVHAKIDNENKRVSVVFKDPEMDGGGRIYH